VLDPIGGDDDVTFPVVILFDRTLAAIVRDYERDLCIAKNC
jgi:hypothetical protein